MKLKRGIRARLGGALLSAVAAVAILALPSLASSHDRGHQPPGDAGVIESFDPETGVLAVSLSEGGTISALVVDRTRIRCGDRHRGRHHRRGWRRRAHRSSRRLSRRGEDRAAEDQAGEDESAPPDAQGRDDQGEDPPGHDGTPPGASEGPGRGADRSARCGTDDLVPGTAVKRAEIVLIDGNAYFRVICLPPPGQPAQEPQPEGEGEGS